MKEKINILCGAENFEKMSKLKPLVPFDPNVISFLNELSKSLFALKEKKLFPELASFGFFCRKANLNKLKKNYNLKARVGRGVTFHISPSNVPINFAFSFVLGILSGNISIVRLSTKLFPQTDLICNSIKQILEDAEYSWLKDYISFIRYERDFEINSFFSSIADVRIIWGGDNSINEIRKSPLPPRSFDITFADRYSFLIINAANYLNIENKKEIAIGFYNDTYLFDQNACSSPRLLYWVGDNNTVIKAKKIFWIKLKEVLIDKAYNIQSITAVNKFIHFCKSAIDFEEVKSVKLEDNLINIIDLNTLPMDITKNMCAGGTFFQYSTMDLDEITSLITRKFQTLSYIGFEKDELLTLLIDNKVSGIDKVVPSGYTSEFSLIWDGYDMILSLSRIIS